MTKGKRRGGPSARIPGVTFRSRILSAALVLALVAGAAAFVLRPRAVPVAEVRRGPLVQSVVATGRVATPARVEVSAQAAARIEQVRVREGDRVEVGQLLAQLRSDEAQAALRQSQAALIEARARVRQIEAVTAPVSEQQLAQAEASARQADAELARARDLVARGFVSQSRLDDAERAAIAARSAVLAAQAQAAGNRRGGVERELARARLAQAEAAVATAQARVDALSLRASVRGLVTGRLAEPGDTAQVGKAVITLAQSGETRIVAAVDERNLRYLKDGQPAMAVADAFPAERFAAQVYYVAPSVDALRGTVEVRLRVPDAPAFLRPDMTVSVEMVVGREDDALLLPADAVRDAQGPAAWVLAARDGRAVRVPVTTGLHGQGTVSVRGELAAGEAVVLATATAQPGDRVRVALPPRTAEVNLREVPGLSR